MKHFLVCEKDSIRIHVTASMQQRHYQESMGEEGGDPIQGRALDSRVGLKSLLLDKTLKENELKR